MRQIAPEAAPDIEPPNLRRELLPRIRCVHYISIADVAGRIHSDLGVTEDNILADGGYFDHGNTIARNPRRVGGKENNGGAKRRTVLVDRGNHRFRGDLL